MRGRGRTILVIALAAVAVIVAGKWADSSPSAGLSKPRSASAADDNRNGSEAGPSPVASRPGKSAERGPAEKPPPGSTVRKLREIVVPVIDVQELTLGEFVELLGKLSIEHDKDPQASRGVRFHLYQPFEEGDPAGKPVVVSTLLIGALKLENMSLERVLQEIGGDSALRFEVRNEEVWIYLKMFPPRPHPPRWNEAEPASPPVDLPPPPP